MPNKQVNPVKKQTGMTMIGAVIVIAAVIFLAVIAMKMLPSYIEFMAVKKVMHAMGTESLSSMSKKEISQAFNRRASIDDIKSVKGEDLIIEKGGSGGTVVSVQYQVITPVMGNVSTLINFATSSDAK